MTNNFIKNIENDRFAKLCGIKIIHIESDYAKIEMKITDSHLNGVNTVHGGAIFTLADFAFAAASNSNGLTTVGINANISYYKSPTGKLITAIATKIAAQNKICGYNVDIFDEDDELIARLTGMGYIKR